MSSYKWSSQTRLLDEVAQALRESIYAGQYAPGTILRQEHIAAEFGISRTPLREALRMLERDGLIIHLPGRGVRVASVDLPHLLDAYAVREVIDGVAARFAAERADATAIAGLEKLIMHQRSIIEPWDSKAYTQSNVDFHLAVMVAGGNVSLENFVPLLRMTSQVFAPAFALSAERAKNAIEEHSLIVEAIIRKDGAGAEELARQHIRKTINSLQKMQNKDEQETSCGRE